MRVDRTVVGCAVGCAAGAGTRTLAVLAILAGLTSDALLAGRAWAQEATRSTAAGSPSPGSADEPVGAIEGMVGWAGFVDDVTIHHTVIGVALPLRVTKSLRVGPELLYMIGPGSDRDVVLSGSLWWDFIGADGPRPPRVVPYLTVGGGWFHHSDNFGGGSDGYVGGGGGARIYLTDRAYLAPEVQLGWELHLRTIVRAGFDWGRR